jgi:hypothetical protein
MSTNPVKSLDPVASPDPSPASAPVRLHAARTAIEKALQALDISELSWTPVGSEHWRGARQTLLAARLELIAALNSWNGAAEADAD